MDFDNKNNSKPDDSEEILDDDMFRDMTDEENHSSKEVKDKDLQDKSPIIKENKQIEIPEKPKEQQAKAPLPNNHISKMKKINNKILYSHKDNDLDQTKGDTIQIQQKQPMNMKQPQDKK